MNVDILGISKLKWTGMGEFNSDDHYIYYCGQDLRRNGELLLNEQFLFGMIKKFWNRIVVMVVQHCACI